VTVVRVGQLDALDQRLVPVDDEVREGCFDLGSVRGPSVGGHRIGPNQGAPELVEDGGAGASTQVELWRITGAEQQVAKPNWVEDARVVDDGECHVLYRSAPNERVGNFVVVNEAQLVAVAQVLVDALLVLIDELATVRENVA